MRQATPPVHLHLEGDPVPTRTLRRALDEIGASHGLAADELFDLKVAATEALANAIKGAGRPQAVDVSVEPGADAIDVEVTNQGPFRLVTMRNDIDSESGRGLPLMFALVDEVEFASTRESTRVRMRKRFSRLEPMKAAAGF